MKTRTLSLLQWNIWREEDIRNIISCLTAWSPDIICAQELMVENIPGGYDAGAIIAYELGYHYFQKTLPGKGVMKQANAIFSRFPLTHHSWTWINRPQGSGGFDDEYRVYLEATANINGTPLTIGTTHMSYTKNFTVTTQKKHETQALLSELQKHRQHFIFAGDLNALPGSEVVNAMSTVLAHAGPDMKEPTWPTKPFSHEGFTANTLDWRLDYVFITPDVKTLSAEVIKTEYSDHLPLLVKILV